MDNRLPGAAPLVVTPLLLGMVSGTLAQLTGKVQVLDRSVTTDGGAAWGIALGAVLISLLVGAWMRAEVARAPRAWLPPLVALVGALLTAVVAQRWIATARVGVVLFPLTSWMWGAFKDQLVAMVFMLPVFLVAMALDVLLMAVSLPGASVLPYAVLILAPVTGAAVGLGVAAVIRARA
ncbi:MAG: hypothetical protein AB2A00_35505 [Myxococcota bacterium]